MHIITEKGEIIEGQALTAEEASILTELTEGGAINDAVRGVYIARETAAYIAKYLIANYAITRRKPAATPEYTQALKDYEEAKANNPSIDFAKPAPELVTDDISF